MMPDRNNLLRKTSNALLVLPIILVANLRLAVEAEADNKINVGGYELNVSPEIKETIRTNGRVVECAGTTAELQAEEYEEMQTTAEETLSASIASELEAAAGLGTLGLDLKAKLKAAIEARVTRKSRLSAGMKVSTTLRETLSPNTCFRQEGYFEVHVIRTTVTGNYDSIWRSPEPLSFELFERRLGELRIDATYTSDCGCTLPANISPLDDIRGEQLIIAVPAHTRNYILPVFLTADGSIYAPLEKIPDEHRRWIGQVVTDSFSPDLPSKGTGLASVFSQ